MGEQFDLSFQEEGLLILEDVLQKYSEIRMVHDNIETFMEQTITESQIYTSEIEIRETVSDISKTINRISNSFQEIQEYKKKGLSSTIWLRDNLDGSLKHLSQMERDSVCQSTKKAISYSNSQMVNLLTNEEYDTHIVPDLKSNNFMDINKTAIALNLKDEIEANTLLKLNYTPHLITNHRFKEISAVKKYYETQLDSKTDDDFKKVVATGIVIAKTKKVLPSYFIEQSTIQITAAIDNGVTHTKTAYKISTGELQAIDAVDYLIDRAVSCVNTVVVHTYQQVGANIGSAVGNAVGTLFGPVGSVIGQTVGQAVGFLAGTAIGSMISRGVDKIASCAKTAIKNVTETIKSTAVSAWEGLKRLKNKLFG